MLTHQYSISPTITSDLTSLRVAILSLGGLGGSGKIATELARELTTAGASVWLLTSPQAQWVSNDELNYIPVSAPKTPTPADSKWIVPLAQEIIQHVETNNIDVLNVHYAVGLLEAALEAMAPFIVTGTLSAYAVFFLVMILLALRLSPLQALLTTLVPEHQRGSLISLVVAVGQLGGGIGGIAAGVAYAEFGYMGNAFLSALFIGLTGLIVWHGLEEPSRLLLSERKRLS